MFEKYKLKKYSNKFIGMAYDFSQHYLYMQFYIVIKQNGVYRFIKFNKMFLEHGDELIRPEKNKINHLCAKSLDYWFKFGDEISSLEISENKKKVYSYVFRQKKGNRE